MPNWCTNQLEISGDKATILALMERARNREHTFVGPFNDHKADFDWGTFTPIQMEALMRDDELFQDKSEKKSVLSFHAFVPMPREVMLAPYDDNRLKEVAAKYPEWFDRFPNILSGYDWEYKNWGCKWGACEAYVENNGGTDDYYSVTYAFDTAWGPPTEFMHKLAALYPNLSFHLFFREEGMGFEGDYYWSDGECTEMDDRNCEREDEEECEEEGEE